MAQKTKIEWTDKTWNPVTGCSKVSEGCRNCYAERIAIRLWGDRDFTEVRMHPERLREINKWKTPQRVFVNSMSDLFHEDVSDDFLNQVFSSMEATNHTFQILTKRPERMQKYLLWRWEGGRIPRQTIHVGVSVENRATLSRIDALRKTPAAVRFISIEPLLEDIGKIDLTWICWVVVGGESGPGSRPCNINWVRSIVSQCKAAAVRVFVKQLGAVPVMDESAWRALAESGNPVPLLTARGDTQELRRKGFVRLALSDRKGGDWNEWPQDLRIREFPK